MFGLLSNHVVWPCHYAVRRWTLLYIVYAVALSLCCPYIVGVVVVLVALLLVLVLVALFLPPNKKTII